MPTLPRSRSRALQIGLALALTWILGAAWAHRGHWVDDAFISLRYTANWLAGAGLVFNPGERVEGVTNLGWVWLVGIASAPLPGSLPVVAKLLGLLGLAGAVVLTSLVHRRLAPAASRVEIVLLPVLVASSPELVYFSLAGMETGLAALLLTIGLAGLGGERPRLYATALAAGALVAVRPEAVVLFPLFAVLLLVARGAIGTPPRHILAALGLFAAIVAALTVFRLGYYGDALPNTFAAKSSGGAEEVARRALGGLLGRHPNLPGPWVGSLVGLLGGAGAWVLWRDGNRRLRPAVLFLVAGLATGVAFAIYAPEDWTAMGRYFAPYVPLAALLALRGLFGGPARVPRAAVPAAVLVTLLLIGIGVRRGRVHLSEESLGTYPGYVLASESLIGPARRVGELLPPGTTVASRRIGALGYFGERPVLDYAFGLTDREVARLRRREGAEPFESPADEALAPLWTRRAPDCLLEDDPVIARLRPTPLDDRVVVHRVEYREVARFPLGDGGAEWVLACRPVELAPGRPEPVR